MPLLVAAGVGTVLTAIGNYQSSQASQRHANMTAKQAKEMADYQWGETKNRESYAQYNVELARLNEESLRLYTDTMNLDKYNRELYIRDYKHKSQVEEYNKTEE